MLKAEINVISRGSVSGGTKKEISNIIQDCYKHFGYSAPYRLELIIAEKESMRVDFLREEKFRMGITDNADEDAFCSHDAFRGYPRITMSLEKLNQVSKLARIGIIRHEAAHTALHGTMEYRIFHIPDESRQIANIKGIEPYALQQAFNNVSSAVKDCEVSRYLIQYDYIDCQLAFALECLSPPARNKASTESAKSERQTRFIYRTALLIPILCTNPLLKISNSKKVSLGNQVLLQKKMEDFAGLVGGAEQTKLLQVANQIIDYLTAETHNNVDYAIRQAMNIA